MVLDRDRAEIELKLDALEQAHDWSAAAELIQSRLERRASRPWRHKLVVRWYEALIAAGTVRPKQEAAGFFERASELAEREGLNKDLAATHLERLNLSGALDRQTQTAMTLAQRDSQREAEVKRINAQAADSQREKGQLETLLLASRAEVQGFRQDLTKVQAEMAKTRSDRMRAEIEMLIDWGDTLQPENPLRKAKYQAAKALAQSHGLEDTATKDRLIALEQAIRTSQPADLPIGQARLIHRVDADTMPPLTVIDLTVHLSAGEAVLGLTAKDFRLTAETNTRAPLAAYCLTTPPKLAQLVLLFDRSNSTAGPRLAAAKTGAVALLKQLQGIANVKTIAFASQLSVVSDWSDEPAAAAPGLQQLSTDGNTALRRALGQATDELQGRDGPKAIVVFTDGRDTEGGPTMADLIARAQKAGIVVHAIALETAELDRDFLGTNHRGNRWYTPASDQGRGSAAAFPPSG